MSDKLNPIEKSYVNAICGIKITKYDQPIKEITYLLTEWEKTEETRNLVKRKKLKVKISNWVNSHRDIPLNKYPKNILDIWKKYVSNYDVNFLLRSGISEGDK